MLRRITVGLFYLFVFAYFFEAVEFGLPLHHTTLLGGLLVLTAAIQPRINFVRPPAALRFFAAYLVACTLLGIATGGNDGGDLLQRLFVFTQLLVLFWITYSLTMSERVSVGFVVVLALGSLAASATQLSGLTSTPVDNSAGRLTMLDNDPNSVAVTLSLGLLSVIGLLFGQVKPARLFQPFALLLCPLLLLIAAAVVATGSRGGFMALGAALVTLALPPASTLIKVRNSVFVAMGIGLLCWFATQSDVFSRRFERSIDSGALSGRDQIYPTAWEMFLEKPLFGWGPIANTRNLSARLHVSGRAESQFGGHLNLQTHNQLLYVLTATGIAGAIPFVIGTWMCVASAWRARSGSFGVLPFALVIAVIVACMSVDAIYWKHHWLILAFGLARGHSLKRENARDGRAVSEDAGFCSNPLTRRQMARGFDG